MLLANEVVTDEMRQVIDIAFDTARRSTYELGSVVPALADVPLELHASYSREEILAALGYASMRRTPATMREGVAWCEAANADAFLVTLKKSDRDYSPTTMYRDFALSPELFHWESQSTTSSASPRDSGTSITAKAARTSCYSCETQRRMPSVHRLTCSLVPPPTCPTRGTGRWQSPGDFIDECRQRYIRPRQWQSHD